MKGSGIRLFLGAVFVIFGLMLLLDNLNIYYFDFYIPHWVFSWYTIMLVVGLILYSGSKNKTLGVIFIAIGGISILSQIFEYRFFRIISDFWPLALIGVGAYILFQRKHDGSIENIDPERTGNSSDYIDDVSIFGGGKKRIQSNNFRGGRVTSIFGGSELNLVESKLAKGESVINVFALFGGSTFTVPKDWNVTLDVTPLLGGFSDERTIFPDMEKQEDRRLTIKGLVIFGGGELKN
ncbi:MAG: cell wall-active antibiotics response protein [Melioribacteraceae bacterium]|nr:cell wall-active antibiotics response protein [Melioribacteraceae bacterium]MCF8413960.1 cell wall-active antibiotics response protein [Melioribacteraceae bacterium]